jgi:hypothetical protein
MHIHVQTIKQNMDTIFVKKKKAVIFKSFHEI